MNKLITTLWPLLPLTDNMRNLVVWLFSPKFTVGVVGLVLDSEGCVLLLRHTYRGNKPWGLPGGGLQAGETLEECLRRELREETGLEVHISGLLSAAAHGDRRLVDTIFACGPRRGYSLDNFQPNAEIAEARYFKPDELPEGMSRGQRRLISVALKQAGK